LLVLGISDLEHDSAVALLDSHRPVAAIEEDKLIRSPGKGGLPRLALNECLRQVGAQAKDISLVGLAFRPRHAWLREQRFRLSLLVSRPGASFGTGDLGRVYRELNHDWHLRQLFHSRAPLIYFEHHLCHAASAYYASEFDRALVLTLDEFGDMWPGLLSLGEGDDLRILSHQAFPDSLAWVYTRVTELLGFRPHRDEHKTQWLSKDGTPEFISVFRAMFKKNANGLPVLKRRFLGERPGGGWAFSPELHKALQISGPLPPGDTQLRAAIARSVQDFLEETVVALAEAHRKTTDAKYLCTAGGLFLNVFLVRALERGTGFEKVFVQPVASNPGTALGAAYLARKQVMGHSVREPLSTLCLGPQSDATTMKAVLDNCKVLYRYLPDEEELLSETVRLLQEDKIVAWFQGRMEFGLRALGNRTILASPYSPYVIENLNRYIKHRESFHPFALSVPAERAPEFFDCTENCRFLASVGALTSSVAGLEQFCFKGNEVRVHTVEMQANPRFWKLLGRFGETAPAPILINTSFNLFGEPLVCDPREAMRSFYCAGIDALVMGNFLVSKG
jgi:carbamoyltransferase